MFVHLMIILELSAKIKWYYTLSAFFHQPPSLLYFVCRLHSLLSATLPTIDIVQSWVDTFIFCLVLLYSLACLICLVLLVRIVGEECHAQCTVPTEGYIFSKGSLLKALLSCLSTAFLLFTITMFKFTII